MKKFFHTLKSRLARRIGLYVILASTILSIFTSGFQVYSEFKREKNGVYSTLEQIEKTHLSNIAARVWVLDSAELNSSLTNLLELSSIRYVAVIEEGKILISTGHDIESNVVIRDFPLTYVANNVNNKVGRLIVKASLDEVYQRVFDRAVLIILSNLVKTFIVAIFIFSGGSFLARYTGHWHNNVTKKEYINHMFENRLIDFNKIQDCGKFIKHLDQRRKRMLMMQMMQKRQVK